MKRLLLVAGLLMVAATLPLMAAAQSQPPTADFVVEPAYPEPGQTLRFEDRSTDEDDKIVNQSWDFGDGHVAWGPIVEHAYPTAGTYQVVLFVRDEAGLEAAAYRLVEIAAPPEPLRFAGVTAWLLWVMPLVTGSLLIGLAYLVVHKGQPAVYNLVFFLFGLASGVKSLSEGFIVLLPEGGIESGAIVLNAWTAYLMGPLFLWFVVVFPRPIHPWLIRGRRGALTLLIAVPFILADLTGAWGDLPRSTIFNVYVSLLALACLGLLVYHAWDIDGDEERQRIRLLGVSFFILVVSNVVIVSLDIASRLSADPNVAMNYASAQGLFGFLILPGLEVLGAVLLLYAILRYQLMGVRRLVSRITRGGIVGITLPSVFVIVGNLIEELFQSTVLERASVRFDFIIAGFAAAVFMVPLQTWVTFVTNKWFPTLESPEAVSRRRMQIYEAQLRYHLLDGALTEKECQVLRRLRDEIQLGPDELANVVKGFPGVELDPLAAPTMAARAAAPAG